MSNLIDDINNEQLNADIPDFGPGDTVVVQVKIKEGTRERLQAYEGVVIAKRNRGLHSAFTVRKISYGEGVERVFQTHSPLIDSVTVKRRGAVRRAKLYYLRELTGRKRVLRRSCKKFNLIQAENLEKPLSRNARGFFVQGCGIQNLQGNFRR